MGCVLLTLIWMEIWKKWSLNELQSNIFQSFQILHVKLLCCCWKHVFVNLNDQSGKMCNLYLHVALHLSQSLKCKFYRLYHILKNLNPASYVKENWCAWWWSWCRGYLSCPCFHLRLFFLFFFLLLIVLMRLSYLVSEIANYVYVMSSFLSKWKPKCVWNCWAMYSLGFHPSTTLTLNFPSFWWIVRISLKLRKTRPSKFGSCIVKKK